MQYSTLTAQLQELQVVFLNRFVKEVTNYIMLLLALQKASLRQSPAESPHALAGSSPRHADASQQQKQQQQQQQQRQQASKPKGPPFRAPDGRQAGSARYHYAQKHRQL